MNVDHTIFEDFSDALKIRNPAIPEKDYYVVQLLKLLKGIEPDYHHMIFSGGSSLTKQNIKIHRMSEDIDMKLVPLPETKMEIFYLENADWVTVSGNNMLALHALAHHGYIL